MLHSPVFAFIFIDEMLRQSPARPSVAQRGRGYCVAGSGGSCCVKSRRRAAPRRPLGLLRTLAAGGLAALRFSRTSLRHLLLLLLLRGISVRRVLGSRARAHGAEWVTSGGLVSCCCWLLMLVLDDICLHASSGGTALPVKGGADRMLSSSTSSAPVACPSTASHRPRKGSGAYSTAPLHGSPIR